MFTSLQPSRGWQTLVFVILITATGCQTQKTVTAAKEYSFWPSAPDEPRIQFLTAYDSSADVTESQSKFEDSIYGKADVLPITKPYGVAMWQGKIYVCDIRSKGITVLDVRQKVTRVMGASGVGEIEKAVDIAIAPDGFKYVVDAGRAVIVAFDQDDHFAAVFGPKDFNPVSVAVYKNELYVADFRGQKIKVLDRATGKQLRTIGEGGPDDGQFVRPLAVRVNPKGQVVVSDIMKCRIQTFTRDGKFLSALGQMGNTPGDLNKPKHLSFDANGYMYVVDAGFNNVQVFDEDGKVVDYFGSAGAHPGSMDLPAGIFVQEGDVDLFAKYLHPAFEAERLILVTNQFGPFRVAVYAQGHLKKGKTVADILPSRAKVDLGVDDLAKSTTRPVAPRDRLPEAIETPTTAPASSSK
ncbi:hypothetical protein BH10PLA1_BH10PLA1_03220 [soil metagenome]